MALCAFMVPLGSQPTTVADGPKHINTSNSNATLLWQHARAKDASFGYGGRYGSNWPRIFLLGTQKGATTALSRAFEHAGACASRQGKEEHMLTTDGTTGDLADGSLLVAAYKDLFPDQDMLHDNCTLHGHYDGNPFLLTDMGVPNFLTRWVPHDLRPKMRFIASLREPAGRMLSWHNQHRRGMGPDPMMFASQVEEELTVWKANGRTGSAQRGVRNFWDLDNETWIHSPPLDMMIGLYHHSLTRWRNAWPRNQIFVFNFDHFSSDSTLFLHALSSFTDLDLLAQPLNMINVHSKDPNAIAHMCCETFCALQDAAFHDANQRLYEMLDQDDQKKRGPPSEPYFGRFLAPQCVYCNSSDAAAPRNQPGAQEDESIFLREEVVTPSCADPEARPERNRELATQSRNERTAALWADATAAAKAERRAAKKAARLRARRERELSAKVHDQQPEAVPESNGERGNVAGTPTVSKPTDLTGRRAELWAAIHDVPEAMPESDSKRSHVVGPPAFSAVGPPAVSAPVDFTGEDDEPVPLVLASRSRKERMAASWAQFHVGPSAM